MRHARSFHRDLIVTVEKFDIIRPGNSMKCKFNPGEKKYTCSVLGASVDEYGEAHAPPIVKSIENIDTVWFRAGATFNIEGPHSGILPNPVLVDSIFPNNTVTCKARDEVVYGKTLLCKERKSKK